MNLLLDEEGKIPAHTYQYWPEEDELAEGEEPTLSNPLPCKTSGMVATERNALL